LVALNPAFILWQSVDLPDHGVCQLRSTTSLTKHRGPSTKSETDSSSAKVQRAWCLRNWDTLRSAEPGYMPSLLAMDLLLMPAISLRHLKTALEPCSLCERR
ncbi:MAG: hypothetical protein M1823_008213, partial [Watsoniomyces obsoletus]